MQTESLEAVSPTIGNTVLPAVTSREGRIETVNQIIQEIASRSRKFFAGKFGVAEVFQKNGRLYMKNEYNTIIDALNLIDEQAEKGNSTYEEDKKRSKAYEKVADFIDKHAKRT